MWPLPQAPITNAKPVPPLQLQFTVSARAPQVSGLTTPVSAKQSAHWVMLRVQSNPLTICTRPRVLIKGKRT